MDTSKLKSKNETKDIKDALKEPTQEQIIEIDGFDDAIYEYHNGELLSGVYGFGFERPTQIQAKSIIPILEGRDLIGQAQAGSGKTAAFLIPALAKIDTKKKYPQVMVVSDTRPLAMQTFANAEKIGAKMIEKCELKVALCIGSGNKNEENHNNINNNANSANNKSDRVTNPDEVQNSHLLIGTPGKFETLAKVHRRGRYKLLDRISLLILDEADILLQIKFAPQIKTIIESIPKTAQICLFSATFTPEIIDVTKKILNNPLKILVKDEELSVEGIKNLWVNVEREEYKYNTLVEIYQKMSICQTIIFVNSVEKTKQLAASLIESGHSVSVIHSELTEYQRVETLERFRKSQTRVLITTDLISRGIDIQKVSIVINYDVPYSPEKYIHRVGRSGRHGKKGVAITFMVKSRNDINRMNDIENKYKINFEELRNAADIESIQNYLVGV